MRSRRVECGPEPAEGRDGEEVVSRGTSGVEAVPGGGGVERHEVGQERFWHGFGVFVEVVEVGCCFSVLCRRSLIGVWCDWREPKMN